MFRMWGKLIKDNHLLKDTIIERCSDSLSRTQMVFDALETICYELDLSKPLWLDANVRELSAITRPGSHRIILSNSLTLIIWKFMY